MTGEYAAWADDKTLSALVVCDEDAEQGDSAQERTVRALREPVLSTVLVGLDRAAAEEHSLPAGQKVTVDTSVWVVVTAPDVTIADAF